jgi:hypothetical protein
VCVIFKRTVLTGLSDFLISICVLGWLFSNNGGDVGFLTLLESFVTAKRCLDGSENADALAGTRNDNLDHRASLLRTHFRIRRNISLSLDSG